MSYFLSFFLSPIYDLFEIKSHRSLVVYFSKSTLSLKKCLVRMTQAITQLLKNFKYLLDIQPSFCMVWELLPHVCF